MIASVNPEKKLHTNFWGQIIKKHTVIWATNCYSPWSVKKDGKSEQMLDSRPFSPMGKVTKKISAHDIISIKSYTVAV